MSFVSFPKIKQFRDVIISVSRRSTFIGLYENGEPIYDNSLRLPTISFMGTTKMHGTNSAVSRAPDTGDLHAQSRNHIITPDSDNAGFARFVQDTPAAVWDQLFESFVYEYPGQRVTIFGEWIGHGIGGAAVREIPERSFVVFGVYIGERGNKESDEQSSGEWFPIRKVPSFVRKAPDCRGQFSLCHIYLITDLSPIFEIDIDFNYPQLSQNKLADLTLEIEKSCPVAKALGAEGIGEGIVWCPVTDGWEDPDYWFKVKGDKHSASKVKTLAQIDPTKVNNIKEFVEEVVTENRLQQALDYIKEMDKPVSRASTGDFVRWVINDIMAEEADTMEASGLVTKDVAANVSNVARKWFFDYLDMEF